MAGRSARTRRTDQRAARRRREERTASLAAAAATEPAVEASTDESPERAALAAARQMLQPSLVDALIENAVDVPEVTDEQIEQAVAILAHSRDDAPTIRLHLENLRMTQFAEGAVALPVEMQPVETLPDVNLSPSAPEVSMTKDGLLRWTADFVPEGRLTDDGRAMAPGSLEWRELPLTLMAMIETTEGGHQGALVSGRIDQIWREGNFIKGSGIFDPGDYGQEIARMVDDKTLRGVSVDIAIHEYEVGPKSDWFDEDGNWAPREAEADAEGERDLLDMLFGADEDVVFVVTKGVIGAVTVCPFPAFADARIELAASLVAAASPAIWTVTQQHGATIVLEPLAPEHDVEAVEPVEPITASAAGFAPVRPPAEWFADPGFEELTPLTVDEHGRVSGHAWAWETCHIGIPDACTTAPTSETQYAYFHLKEVECEDGSRVPCGTITLETPHADRRLGRADASAHYDNTGTAAADVIVGEDAYGGWVSGALRPDVDAERARDLRGAVLSGDWRNVNGNLELVALLAVNVPGFPVPRARALVASGEEGSEVLALVAAGLNLPRTEADAFERMRALRAFADGKFAALGDRAAAAFDAETQEA